ncbi:MAG: hypothetical protein P4N41_18035 [Negativicutes bacterium]|nr:hypothetical protein [Negativicutes bacterium]
MLNGTIMIAQERERQVRKEGWTTHEDQQKHPDGELSIAAACYAVEGTYAKCVANHYDRYTTIQDAWPWHPEWDKRKKHDRIRRLIIAGALIAAEIDRLLAESERP